MIGAGLSGLAAALDLAESGRRTLLIERRPYVGGKVYSFEDPRHGVVLDNGHHITMRCCTALQSVLERVGREDLVEYSRRLDVPVFDPRTRRWSRIASADFGWISVLLGGRSAIPAPFHLAGSLLAYRHLSLREKARLPGALRALQRLAREEEAPPDDVSFGDWLRLHRQTERLVDQFWDLILRPICNDRPDFVSAAQAVQVFRDGFLRDSRAAEIGLFRAGLSQLPEAILQRFERHGGQIAFRRRARALVLSERSAARIEFDHGSPLDVSGVVLALPPDQALELLPQVWRRREPFRQLDRFEHSPIVNVHLRWSQPCMREPFAAILDDRTQFVFNRSRIHAWGGDDQWLTCSLSAAFEQNEMSRERIVADAVAGVRQAWPAAGEARLLASRVIREPQATFRPRPGIASCRPGPRTPIANLVLAGAWTATGWPATMESAVRSGQAAADELCRSSEGLGPADGLSRAESRSGYPRVRPAGTNPGG